MPLSMANPGECVTIRRITGKDDTIRFLNRLGLIEGEPIMVISSMAGDLILGVKGARIALGKQLTSRIVV